MGGEVRVTGGSYAWPVTIGFLATLVAICWGVWYIGERDTERREQEYRFRMAVVTECANVDVPTRCVADINEALDVLDG